MGCGGFSTSPCCASSRYSPAVSSSDAVVGQKQSSAQCWLKVRLARVSWGTRWAFWSCRSLLVPWAPGGVWLMVNVWLDQDNSCTPTDLHGPQKGLRLMWTVTGLVNGTESKASSTQLNLTHLYIFIQCTSLSIYTYIFIDRHKSALFCYTTWPRISQTRALNVCWSDQSCLQGTST